MKTLTEFLKNKKASSQNTEENSVSVSMSFEDCLLSSSKERNSYSATWVNSEIENSKNYFIKEISKD